MDKQINSVSMQEQLISFETATLAKEKGFNIPVWNYWQSNIEGKWNNFLLSDEIGFHPILDDYNEISDKHISQPSQSLLQKWIREVHHIHVILHPHFDNYGDYEGWEHIKSYSLLDGSVAVRCMSGHETYEDALENGLYEGLKLIK
jgi:hypothetical protein